MTQPQEPTLPTMLTRPGAILLLKLVEAGRNMIAADLSEEEKEGVEQIIGFLHYALKLMGSRMN